MFLVPFSRQASFFKQTNEKNLLFVETNLHQLRKTDKLSYKTNKQCDLSESWVNYYSKGVKCNKQDLDPITSAEFTIYSSASTTTSNSITFDLTDSETVKVHLQSIIIDSACPMKVDGSGTLKLYLSGTNTLTAIQDSDTNNNNNYNYNAGIACLSSYVDIIIDKEETSSDDYSGQLIAKGTGANPGIGTVCSQDNKRNCHTIQINGGFVHATGADGKFTFNSVQYPSSGAGIGTGCGGIINHIYVKGGIVYAKGGTEGAGIGVGGYGEVNDINFTGGTTYAYAGKYGAGIGSGSGRYSGDKVGSIRISNVAYVYAYTTEDSSTGAAIGAGGSGNQGQVDYSSKVDYILIEGGTVYASVAYNSKGAGIGGGWGSSLTSASVVGHVEITGGTVIVFGSTEAHGIGCGLGESHTSDSSGRLDKLTITNVKRLYGKTVSRHVIGQDAVKNQRVIGTKDIRIDIKCNNNENQICGYPWDDYDVNPLIPTTIPSSPTRTCNIEQGQISLKSFYYTCNNSPVIYFDRSINIIGSSTSNSINLEMLGDYAIYLHGVEINTSCPIYAQGSGTLYIYFENNNILESSGNPTIDIESGSVSVVFNELTPSTNDENQLHNIVKDGAFSAIGTKSYCNEIIIESGYVEARGNDGNWHDNEANADGKNDFISSGAGIGSSTYGEIIRIKILGGKVNSTGGTYGAGIGTGNYGYIKEIIIQNGYVESYGGLYGAGIGTGWGGRNIKNGYKVSHIDLIHISGGIVNAYSIQSGAGGAGIGAGYGKGSYSSYVIKIWIDGGTIHAEVSSDGYGAAIGAGYGNAEHSSYVDYILIEGGDTTAIGANGAGIGGGYGVGSSSSRITYSIIINGGTVHAEGGYGSAIGAGYGYGPETSYVDLIQILGTDTIVYAEVPSNGKGAAIGGGFGNATSSSYVTTIQIDGGKKITAIGPQYAAGIGNGWGEDHTDEITSMVTTLTIDKAIQELFASSLNYNGSLGQIANPNNRLAKTVTIDSELAVLLYYSSDETTWICQYPAPEPTPTTTTETPTPTTTTETPTPTTTTETPTPTTTTETPTPTTETPTPTTTTETPTPTTTTETPTPTTTTETPTTTTTTETPTPTTTTETPTPTTTTETPTTTTTTTTETPTPTTTTETPTTTTTTETPTPTTTTETPTPTPTEPPVQIPVWCICETSTCTAKQGYYCSQMISSISDAIAGGTSYVYVAKDDNFLVDLTNLNNNITIIINIATASFVVEYGNSITPYKHDGTIDLLIYHSNSESYITSDDKVVTFVSDYNNKITFVAKEDVKVIVPQSELQKSSTVDFKFPINFDFPEGSSASLSVKSVDENGSLSSNSLSDIKSSPQMTYSGTPANLETLASLGSFVQAELALENQNEEETASEDGEGSSSSISIVGVSLISIFGVLAIILATLALAIWRKKKAPAKVDQILEI